jgi:hypothetical protein
MCTMTWIREPGGYQVFFNRDERRTRKAAAPPALRRHSGRRFIAPLDGDHGGSWLAANECGLTLALHNGYGDSAHEPAAPSREYVSRGLLVTALIDAPSAEEALGRLGREDLRPFRPFLLTAFAVDGTAVLASWLGHSLSREALDDDAQPLVSSAFDTAQVRTRRIELFRRMRQELAAEPAELHLAFHASHVPRRGAYSPCMHRPDAATVSFSRVRVASPRVEFHYAPHAPCRGLPTGKPVTLRMRSSA